MSKNNRLLAGVLSSVIMFIFIIDPQTSLKGAKEGVTLCLYTVIPSMFPFLIFSSIINSVSFGMRISLLRPLGQLCKIPSGSESLLLLGFIGGYPVGAQSIAQAYKCNALTKEDAERMLGFCNNAGPAFIFGMLSPLFAQKTALVLLWAIHIVSAIVVALLLPGKSKNKCKMISSNSCSMVYVMEKSIIIMARICGWIIMFRILITFLSKWVLWMVPNQIQITLAGLLEISNGCMSLYYIDLEGLRFILASLFLNFGGLCVYMQTKSVTNMLGTGMYFPGKILQCSVSLILSSVVQSIIFPNEEIFQMPLISYILLFILSIIYLLYIKHKNNSRNLATNSV